MLPIMSNSNAMSQFSVCIHFEWCWWFYGGLNRPDGRNYLMGHYSAELCDASQDGTLGITRLSWLHPSLFHLSFNPATERWISYWSLEMGKPRLIILIRHAQSEGNKNREIHQLIPDHRVKLTEEGWRQVLLPPPFSPHSAGEHTLTNDPGRRSRSPPPQPLEARRQPPDLHQSLPPHKRNY
jgi:hypothetical protein